MLYMNNQDWKEFNKAERRDNMKLFLKGVKIGIIDTIKDPKVVALAVTSGVLSGLAVHLKNSK